MEQVFNTPELLEHVLLQVDLHDLLVSAQRVNRQWHALISDSPTLQSALFFRPSPSPSPSPSSNQYQDQEQHQEPRRNPLLLRRFPSLHKLFWPPPALQPSNSNSSSNSPVISSSNTPLYQWTIPPSVFFSPRNGDLLPLLLLLLLPEEVTPHSHSHSHSRDGASWRRMLVQQRPAARSVAVCARLFEIAGPPGGRAYRLLGHSVVRYDFAAADYAVRMRHLVAWLGGSSPSPSPSPSLARSADAGVLGVLCGLSGSGGGVGGGSGSWSGDTSPATAAAAVAGATSISTTGPGPGPARGGRRRAAVPVFEFVRACLSRDEVGGGEEEEEEEEEELWPSGGDVARVDGVIGTADVLLVREFDVALLPPHPNLKPRDFLLYGPKWEDLDKEDRPEPRQVTEFHSGAVEAWFEEHHHALS